MPNQVEIRFVGVDQSFTATKDKIISGVGDVDRAVAQSSRNIDASFAVFKGQVLFEFFKRGASSAVEFGKEAVQAFNESRSALLGLQTVARFQGIGGDPTAALRDLELVKQGLLSTTEAATALKNLLSTGFNLDQSVDLIRRFGDSAAFNKQASLSFGEAVVRTTEGIRLNNSVLSDAGGIATNLAVLQDRAKIKYDDLADATKRAGAAQAYYQQFVRETAPYTGDASRLTQEFAGQLSRLEAAQQRLLDATGQVIAQNPDLAKGIGAITDEIGRFADEAGRAGSGVNEALKDTVSLAGEAAQSIANLAASVREVVGLYKQIKDSPIGTIYDLASKSVYDALGITARDAPEVSGRSTRDRGPAPIIPKTAPSAAQTAAITAQAMASKSAAEREAVALLTTRGDLSAAQNQRLHFIMDFELDQAGAEKVRAEALKLTNDLLQTEREARDQIAQLGRELNASNPFVTAFSAAEARAEQFEAKFAGVSDSIRAQFQKTNDEVLALDLFKGRLSVAGTLNDLLTEKAKLDAGLAGQAIRDKNTETAATRAAIEQEIFSRRQAGTLTGADQNALLDRFSATFRQSQADQIARDATDRAIATTRAALASATTAEQRYAALQFGLGATSNIANLTTDQAAARGGFVDQMISAQQDYLKSQMETQRRQAESIAAHVTAMDNHSKAMAAFAGALGKGVTFDVNVRDQQPSTASVLQGEAPGASIPGGVNSPTGYGTGIRPSDFSDDPRFISGPGSLNNNY